MARGIGRYLVIPFIVVGVAGCRFMDFAERDPWRTQAEEECVAAGVINASAHVEPASELNGPGVCGMVRPYKVAAVNHGFVGIEPRATLACPLIANVEAWFAESIQPAAHVWFAEPVVEIKQISAYSCRSMNGQPGAAISEHAFGNALDIASFRLASGREVTVKDGWRGRPEERGFLRQVHAAACDRFATVLAPGADAFHYDHIHVDLARRASRRSICKPEPSYPAPPAPMSPIVSPREVPVARAPAPAHAPWARNAHHAPPMQGPMVIERDPASRVVGPPLALSGHRPPGEVRGSPIESRVMQSLSVPPAPVTNQPAPPFRPLPPGSVPNARHIDPVTTGSVDASGTKAGFAARPHALADERAVPQPPLSVFDLPRTKAAD